jgi:plastocyanin domain-containing protein
VKAAKSRHLV